MNIEEERKAFLIECRTMFGNAYYPVDTGFANGEFFDPTVQRPFEVWLKAKAHSEEICERWITRSQLLIDGCVECDDLLIEDMKPFWRCRPKAEKLEGGEAKIYLFDTQPGFHKGSRFVYTDERYVPKDWTGLL